MRLRLVGDPGTVQSDGLPFKKASQGLIQRGRIGKICACVNVCARAYVCSAIEIVIDLTFKTKAKPEARTITIGADDTKTTRVPLKDSIVSYTNCSAKT